MHTMIASVRMNIRWFNAYSQVVGMWQRNQQQVIRQAGELGRYIARVHDEISEINRQAYENQQRSNDRVYQKMSNAIRGVERYDSPHTEVPVSLPSDYENAWVSDTGEYYLTNNPGDDPNVGSTTNWHRMRAHEP